MIKCRALEEKSLFVTADGKVLPCCFIYRGGPNLTPELKEILSDPTFKKLTDTWNTDKPFYICYDTCDTESQHQKNMIRFDKQVKNKTINK